jgi:hypothetical protein
MKEEANMVTERQTLLSYRDPGGRQIQVSISKEEKDTQIALIVNTPKKTGAN